MEAEEIAKLWTTRKAWKPLRGMSTINGDTFQDAYGPGLCWFDGVKDTSSPYAYEAYYEATFAGGPFIPDHTDPATIGAIMFGILLPNSVAVEFNKTGIYIRKGYSGQWKSFEYETYGQNYLLLAIDYGLQLAGGEVQCS